MPVTRRGGAWGYSFGWKGRSYRRSSSRWTRKDAQEIEAKALRDLHAVEAGRQPERSFADGIAKYIADELPQMKPRTQAEALKNIGYITASIEGRMLSEAKDAAADIRRRFADLSPATINRRLQIVNRIVNLAYKEWGWLDKPTPIPMLPERERERFLTRAEVERIARKCPRSGDLIRLLAYTGIRKSQALALTPEHARGGYLHLGRDGKSGKPQLVPIHARIRPIVRKLPLPVTLGILHKEWYAALEATGIRARIHDLRHTTASWMLQAGADLIHVRDMLGHSSVAVTQRYAHLGAKHLRQAVNRVK